jgi:hypothetical protein
MADGIREDERLLEERFPIAKRQGRGIEAVQMQHIEHVVINGYAAAPGGLERCGSHASLEA